MASLCKKKYERGVELMNRFVTQYDAPLEVERSYFED